MSLNRPFAPALAAVLALTAGACASTGGQQGQAALPLTPLDQFKVQVEQAPEELALAPHGAGLSPAQAAAIGQFAARWREAGGGEIAIRAPRGGDAAAVSQTSAAAQAALEGLGVPPGLLRRETYDAGDAPRPPLVVSYVRYTAKGPDCSQHWDNLSATGQNRPSTHFGCANTANFAAQIADPRDLLRPAAEDPADATRRANVIDLYRKGDVTSSKQDQQASGAVSKVVQ